MNFLKNNFILAVMTLLVATASCSFTKDRIDPGDKEKEQLLVNLISHVLKRQHFSPADLTDEFSQDIFENYINDLDPAKRYFLASDYEEFKKYEYLIDDQIRESKVDLFNLTYERLLKRQKESQKIFQEVIAVPFDFTQKETINTDYEAIPYAKDRQALKNHWRKLLKLSALSSYFDKVEEQNSEDFEGEKKSLTELEKEVRKELKKSMEENFDLNEDVERLDYFSLFVNAITAHFDPHTNYFPPQNKDRFDTSMSGQLEGIGARLQKKMDYISIIEIISGGPASRNEDIEIGDKIMKVAQENDSIPTSIVGMRISDAVDLIKGPKGTKVHLTLKKVDGNVKTITLIRDVVQIEETFAKTVIGKDDTFRFGLIDLPKFYFDFDDPNGRAAGNDVAKEITRLKETGMDGLILDLRSNGGGSLREVVEMAGLFIEEGPVVQVALKNKRTQTLRDRDSGEILWEGPLVIMVDEFSASASEILAAAMQDYDRAVILGSKQTFGKGTVQNFEDLNQWVRNHDYGDLGAIKLTTQKFYRVNGSSTQLEGVKSDVVTPDKYSYIDIGERDEQFPLPYDEIAASDYKKFEGYLNLSEAIENSQKRVDTNPMFKLLDENAKWLSDQRDDNLIPLNFEEYKSRISQLEEETEKYDQLSDYKNNMQFELMDYEKTLVAIDSSLKDKRESWIKNLGRDIYVQEAVQVLKELRMNNIVNSNKPKLSIKE
ncbi:carboxy terminal-processing peptidase [Nonlabens xiamenensis]|uniref:carboxy terminal-processing peptidase n=1 Tax=Nonlabens xiamenensis TaxID=2341043 RepID=UPI000F60CC21|nr:carboxy terminal-processing peptidase [Nonlabens xiamenensis]